MTPYLVLAFAAGWFFAFVGWWRESAHGDGRVATIGGLFSLVSSLVALGYLLAKGTA